MIETNRKEIWRYLGYKGREPDGRVKERIEQCLDRLGRVVTPGFLSDEFDLAFPGENEMTFAGIRVRSRHLFRNLCGCRRVVLFAATLGIGPDRLIARAGVNSPSDMVIYQAAAAAMIESYCDRKNEEIRCMAEEKGLFCRPRFSPGYGDFALEYQRELLQVLGAAKRIGITLTDSLLMMPSKSVTALIGLSEQDKADGSVKCMSCEKKDCVFRSE